VASTAGRRRTASQPRIEGAVCYWQIVLQKSPSGLYEVEICNYRIGAPVLLNRCCAFQPDLESIFLAEMLKILLQHNRHETDVQCVPTNVCSWWKSGHAADITAKTDFDPNGLREHSRELPITLSH
jgi:hypothetical protein